MKIWIVSFALVAISNIHALPLEEISKILEESTIRVSIWNTDKSQETLDVYAGGSGVILNKIDDVYFILTNAHVALETHCLASEFDTSIKTGCRNQEYDYRTKSVRIDTTSSQFEYIIDASDFIYWDEWDVAILRIESEEDLSPIRITTHAFPLMDIYAGGFPIVLGNYEIDYRDIYMSSGNINSYARNDESFNQLDYYRIIHSAQITGGMSGGPLLNNDAELVGIKGLVGSAEILSDGSVDLDNSRYAYAIDIKDIYILGIQDNEYQNNPDSDFYHYLPDLDKEANLVFFNQLTEQYPEFADNINSVFTE